ncbi:choice-of-anchor D domain-containing protein [bacterium]|nr:choice-of-anchor D domain-containing protein [bacterium]
MKRIGLVVLSLMMLASLGFAQRIHVEPEALNFGEVLVGNEAVRGIGIFNHGDGELVIEVGIEGGAFYLNDFEGGVVPDEGLELHVVFAPEEPGEYNGVLMIFSNDREHPVVEVPLHGFAVGNHHEGGPLVVEPEELNFGQVLIGTEVVAEVMLANVGDETAFFSATVDGARFFMDTIEEEDLPPGHEVFLQIVFEPNEEGEYNGALIIDNLEGEQENIVVPLHGAGILEHGGDGWLELTTDHINFGEVEVGEEAQEHLGMINRGEETVEVWFSWEPERMAFSVGTDEVITIPPGDDFGVGVYFEPPEQGEYASALIVHSNDPEHPEQVVEVVGFGVGENHEGGPRIEYEPEAIHFGDIPVGDEVRETIHVYNRGDEALVVAGGINGGGFSMEEFDEMEVPDEGLHFQVTFAPEEQGHYEGMVVLWTNDPEHPEVGIPLSGHGGEEGGNDGWLQVNPHRMVFENVAPGQEDSRRLGMLNTSDETVVLEFSWDPPRDAFSIEVNEIVELPPGEDFGLDIWFHPPEQGRYTTDFVISSNIEGQEDVYVEVIGEAGENHEGGPRIQVTREGLHFGEVEIGTEANLEFGILSVGNELLDAWIEIEGWGFFGPDDEHFEIEPEWEEYFNVTFAPNELGRYEGTMIIESNDPNRHIIQIPMSGWGVEGDGEPVPGRFEPVEPTGLPYTVVIQSAILDEEPLRNGAQIGIFDGDLCVGVGEIEPEMEYPFPIIVWEGDPDQEVPGFEAGSPISYRYWVPEEGVFNAAGEYERGNGTFGNDIFTEVALSGFRTRLLNIPLQANYFEMVSFNIEPMDLDANYVFDNLENLAIVYQHDGGIYIDVNINTIFEITPTFGYRIFMYETEELQVEGYPLPANTEYHLEAGPWNWLGYPFNHEMAITSALGHIGENIEIAITDDGFVWIPALGINTIPAMHPGEGYMVVVNEDVTFTYNEGNDLMYDGSTQNTPLVSIPGAPQPTGLPYAVIVELSDDLMMMKPAVIEINDGSQLVGKALVDESTEYQTVTTWMGSEEHGLDGFVTGNPMSIRLLDATGIKVPANSHGELPNFGDGAYGLVELASQSIELPNEFVVETAYPNPFNPSVTVPFVLPDAGTVKVAMFNINGQEVYSNQSEFDSGRHRIHLDVSGIGNDFVSGVYFLQVQFDGQVQTQKLMLLK